MIRFKKNILGLLKKLGFKEVDMSRMPFRIASFKRKPMEGPDAKIFHLDFKYEQKPIEITDKQMDEIYDEIDTLCHESKWREIDNILREIDVDNQQLDYLLAYLTITFCVQDKLNYRAEFFHKCESRFAELAGLKEAESLLQGLAPEAHEGVRNEV